MWIKARTKYGQDVVIIGFVNRYNEVYAVTVEPEFGTIESYNIDILKITDSHIRGGEQE